MRQLSPEEAGVADALDGGKITLAKAAYQRDSSHRTNLAYGYVLKNQG
jgi:hypothetical protein